MRVEYGVDTRLGYVELRERYLVAYLLQQTGSIFNIQKQSGK